MIQTLFSNSKQITLFQVTPEESKIEPLELISTIKLFDEPITTIYKRIQNTDSSFLKWANLADQITKQLTMDDKRVRRDKIQNIKLLS